MYNAIIFSDVTDHLVSIPSIGPYKLAHSLRKNGFTCLVVNHLSEWSYDELTNLIDTALTDETFLVGFSTTFVMDKVAVDKQAARIKDLDTTLIFPQGKEFEKSVIKYIRSKSDKVKVVVGGSKVNAQYNNKNIDYVSLGYSEVSIVNLMNHLVNGSKLENAMKNLYGRVIIDDRYAKSYDFANEDMQWLDIDVVNHKCIPIEVGRGCIFKCKFCSYPLNGKQNLDFVKRPDLIKAEFEYNYDKFGIKNYIIVDDTFNDHIDKLRSFEKVVSELSFKPVLWGYHRLDLICIKPETLDILYNMGIRGLHFGIESFTPAAAKSIGKGYNTNKMIEMIAFIKDKYPDMILHASLIVGLPGESVEQVTEVSRRLVAHEIKLDSWYWHPLTIEQPGSLTYTSEFSADYASFGYTDIGTGSDEFSINWNSADMNRDKAIELADIFNNDSMWKTTERVMNPYFTMQLASYGFDYKEISKVKFNDFPFGKIQQELKPNHHAEYKAKLLELIKC